MMSAKKIIPSLILTVILGAAAASAQNALSLTRPAVAVYTAGVEPRGAEGINRILGGELARTISESGRYLAVDRTDEILGQIAKEHLYQREGGVDDDQIKELGKQLGAQYLCISGVSTASARSYYLDVRLVDVTTAEILRSATGHSSLKNAAEMTRAAHVVAYELIETEKAAEERKLKKKMLLSTAIFFDGLGAATLAYGIIVENGIVDKYGNKYGGTFDPRKANSALVRRNAAYIAAGAMVAGGVTMHILF